MTSIENKKTAIGVMFLAENLKIHEMRASHLTSLMQIWAKPKPLYNRKRARVQGENPYILALFDFIDELMLTHHELVSP